VNTITLKDTLSKDISIAMEVTGKTVVKTKNSKVPVDDNRKALNCT